MHVISFRTLRDFYEKHAAAKPYLTAWFKTTKKAEWGSVNDVRSDFPSAEMVVDGKVVFNIKANDYRLVALVGFRTKKVFILWVGTHADYDKGKNQRHLNISPVSNALTMNIKLIRNEADYQTALRRIRELWEAEVDTPEADELEITAMLVSRYEEEHYPIEEPDPIEYIKVRMEELGLSQADLVPYMGNKGNVSKVLNRKRSLSLDMIRNLHRGLRFPLEVLIAEP